MQSPAVKCIHCFAIHCAIHCFLDVDVPIQLEFAHIHPPSHWWPIYMINMEEIILLG
jgi:hypothetical protein